MDFFPVQRQSAQKSETRFARRLMLSGARRLWRLVEHWSGIDPVAAGPAPAPQLAFKPEVMLLQINLACNLRCAFCDHHLYNESMPFSMAARILDDMALCGIKSLVITGGEPFLHPQLFEIICLAKQRYIGINITTNGTLLKAMAEQVRDSGVDSLSISIDGPPELHDQLRGRKGTYDKIMAGLDRLAEVGAHPAINIYTVVTNLNVDYVGELYGWTKERGYEFNFWPVNNAPELALKSEREIAAYREFFGRVTADDPAFAGRRRYYELGLLHHAAKPMKVRCLGVRKQVGITPDGTVIPCCMWGDKAALELGNLNQSSLVDILNHPDTRHFQARMESHGCPVACYNHSLYEYEIATGKPAVIEGEAT